MSSWDFTATGPIRANLELPSGSVQVTAAKTETVRVSLIPSGPGGEKLLADTEVSFEGETLRVHVPSRTSIRRNASLDLTVELPEDSSIRVKTASADVTCEGALGPVNATTASGDVRVNQVSGDADLTTASGDVRIDDVTADVRVSTASGDVEIGRAGGDIIAKTASGDVSIGHAGQSASAKTASGDVRIDSIASGLADATTVSGDITVAVVPGVGVYLDVSTLSGDVSSDLDSDSGAEGDASLTVSGRSVSGDVRIIRASR
jgi:DUF4097 and DUF4098 domain-containing protein YvlB